MPITVEADAEIHVIMGALDRADVRLMISLRVLALRRQGIKQDTCPNMGEFYPVGPLREVTT